MTKVYKQKPNKVTAYQWEGQGADEEATVRRYKASARDLMAKCSYCKIKMQDHGRLELGERSQIVCPGSFIVTAEDGRLFACDAATFAANYEVVDGTQD